VVAAPPGHFLANGWIDAGRSGAAGHVVWVAYADFDLTGGTENAPSRIKAVRCDTALRSCTRPVLISGRDKDTQYPDVTLAGDGRVYISWVERLGRITPNPAGTGQSAVIKVRVAEPGQTRFGPPRIVYRENLAIPVNGLLDASDFRLSTHPKHAVLDSPGGSRLFFVWDACRARVVDQDVFAFRTEQAPVCEAPLIKLRYSDDRGTTWSRVHVLSVGGNNYFPTIDADPVASKVAVAWYTSRFDPKFANSQDVELVGVGGATGAVTSRQRVTRSSSEPEADPFLAGYFIGDYIEVAALRGTAYVHYSASYRRIRFLDEGLPVAQADNFLSRRRL
jgi:hypothetical protein